eukprot:COSAG01_NODE_51187_length_356_cov_18.595331_1_plen_88_part_10
MGLGKPHQLCRNFPSSGLGSAVSINSHASILSDGDPGQRGPYMYLESSRADMARRLRTSRHLAHVVVATARSSINDALVTDNPLLVQP